MKEVLWRAPEGKKAVCEVTYYGPGQSIIKVMTYPYQEKEPEVVFETEKSLVGYDIYAGKLKIISGFMSGDIKFSDVVEVIYNDDPGLVEIVIDRLRKPLLPEDLVLYP